jgi:hypothetical protein
MKATVPFTFPPPLTPPRKGEGEVRGRLRQDHRLRDSASHMPPPIRQPPLARESQLR